MPLCLCLRRRHGESYSNQRPGARHPALTLHISTMMGAGAAGVYTALRAACCGVAGLCIFWFAAYILEFSCLDEVDNGGRDALEKQGGYITYNNPNTVEKAYLLSAGNLWRMIVVFLPGLVAGLATYAFISLPKGSEKAAHLTHSAKDKALRVLRWPLPGQKFWQWWCGGLCFGEIVFFLFSLGCIGTWLRYRLEPRYARWAAVEEIIVLGDEKNWLALDQWGVAFGLALIPLFLILFWPCAQNSWLNSALGLSWGRMIKYHRWVGHITLWTMTAHGVTYLLLWALEPGVNFWHEFSSWQDSVPFFPGTLAFLFAFALWITSLYYFRRNLFEVFYKMHIIGFVGMMIFACIHYSSGWYYLLPGLMPWMVDVAFRNAQSANVTTIVRGHTTADGSITSIELAVDKRVRACPAAELFINIPSISLFQWHPFSVAKKTGDIITLHMKTYGNFTKTVMAKLNAGIQMPVRVTGPTGIKETHALHYPMIIIISGGVGASPGLCLINDLLDRKARGETQLPSRVKLLWTTRKSSELSILDERILSAARSDDGWLTVELFCTAGVTALPPPKRTNSETSGTSRTSSMNESFDTPDAKAAANARTQAHTTYAADGGMYFPWASPLGLALARPVQLKTLGVGQAAAALVLAHVGAFFCWLLAYSYQAEPSSVDQFRNEDVANQFAQWKLGVLLLVASVVGGIGLPAFIIHPVSLFSYFRARRQARGGADALAAEPAMRPTIVTSHPSIVANGQVGMEEANLLLPISSGRPDIRGKLAASAEEAANLGFNKSIGVFVGGPQPLVQSVRTYVQDFNRSRQEPAPRLDVHVDTWEM